MNSFYSSNHIMKLRKLFSKSPRYLLRCIVTVMLLGGFFIPGLAQNVKLTGTVRGADDNAPLIGASVKSSSGVIAVTDADGAFSINVEKVRRSLSPISATCPRVSKSETRQKSTSTSKKMSKPWRSWLWSATEL